jgi:RNA polymerase sigma-70 factor (ECF subfamily)
MPALTWTLPRAGQEWNLTVVRQEPAARREEADTSRDVRSVGELDGAALVAACVSGRPGAFDLVVERHQRAIYQLCFRFTNNHEDAADLSQEVFLRAFRGLHRFRGQSALATWLYRIGVNVCLNRTAARNPLSRATEPVDEARHVDNRSESISERLLREERAVRVRAAIAQLPDRQRATLILRVYHELTHQEIADILGTSVGAVKANFFHALNNLKRLLGNVEGL